MTIFESALNHISETAKVPSFSTYEERLHPYVRSVFKSLPGSEEIDVSGNSLIFKIPNNETDYTVALAAHLDKINHYGKNHPNELPVEITESYIEGAMDDSAGLGIILALAENLADIQPLPGLLFFFSEMEESKGLKEHPHLLKKKGDGYTHGMGARNIAGACLEGGEIPDEVITVDTTPLFKGEPGVALYSKHWEYNNLDAGGELIDRTRATVEQFKEIDSEIHLDNNTNDYLHYGYKFNAESSDDVVSVALEPAIFPYHQKGERVYKKDIDRVLKILVNYLNLIS